MTRGGTGLSFLFVISIGFVGPALAGRCSDLVTSTAGAAWPEVEECIACLSNRVGLPGFKHTCQVSYDLHRSKITCSNAKKTTITAAVLKSKNAQDEEANPREACFQFILALEFEMKWRDYSSASDSSASDVGALPARFQEVSEEASRNLGLMKRLLNSGLSGSLVSSMEDEVVNRHLLVANIKNIGKGGILDAEKAATFQSKLDELEGLSHVRFAPLKYFTNLRQQPIGVRADIVLEYLRTMRAAEGMRTKLMALMDDSFEEMLKQYNDIRSLHLTTIGLSNFFDVDVQGTLDRILNEIRKVSNVRHGPSESDYRDTIGQVFQQRDAILRLDCEPSRRYSDLVAMLVEGAKIIAEIKTLSENTFKDLNDHTGGLASSLANYRNHASFLRMAQFKERLYVICLKDQIMQTFNWYFDRNRRFDTCWSAMSTMQAFAKASIASSGRVDCTAAVHARRSMRDNRCLELPDLPRMLEQYTSEMKEDVEMPFSLNSVGPQHMIMFGCIMRGTPIEKCKHLNERYYSPPESEWVDYTSVVKSMSKADCPM